jgi:hypothetical protein
MSVEEVHDALRVTTGDRWGLDKEIEEWGMQMPTHLAHILFADEPVEWNRIGAFQDVTLRLIAIQILQCQAPGCAWRQASRVMLANALASGQKDEPAEPPNEMAERRWPTLRRDATRIRLKLKSSPLRSPRWRSKDAALPSYPAASDAPQETRPTSVVVDVPAPS